MKKGFTLIELLAVIVILAIIALIATPIILNIINDAKQESQERSIELYASAIKNGIAAYQLREGKEVAAGSYTTDSLPLTVEYEGDVECDTIDIYADGGVYVAGCTVNGDEIDYTYGTKQIVKGKLSSVCTPSATQYFSTNPLGAGYKYDCKVDPNKEPYTFYVMTTPAEGATSVNLIMDSNINASGEAVKEGVSDLGNVTWVDTEGYVSVGGSGTNFDDNGGLNDKGPITAMNRLEQATSTWTNLNTMTVSTFTDENGTEYNMGKTYNTYARMPYYSEIGSGEYFNDNLYVECYDEALEKEVSCDVAATIVGYYGEKMGNSLSVGYWTLSAVSDINDLAWYTSYYLSIGDDGTYENVTTYYGIRPVITLDI